MATREEPKTFMIEGAQIIFRNFEGREGPMNGIGERNFACILPPDFAEELLRDDWNVKYLQPREEGEEATPYITVKVNFRGRPPRVVMMTSRARQNLSEDTVQVLDWADIEYVDLICNAYEWAVGGKTGIKAYCKSLFVMVREDALEKKWAVNELSED